MYVPSECNHKGEIWLTFKHGAVALRVTVITQMVTHMQAYVTSGFREQGS